MKKKPTLAEFLGLDWVLDLHEVFNTSVPVKQWEARGNLNVGKLLVGEEEFEIYLEPLTYTFDGQTINLINVAFAKLVDGKPTEQLQLNSKNASTIIGAVVSAVRDKLPEYDYDAVAFAATDNVEQRMRVYNYVTRQLKGLFSHTKQSIATTNGGKVTVLFSNSISPDKLDALERHLKELGK